MSALTFLYFFHWLLGLGDLVESKRLFIEQWPTPSRHDFGKKATARQEWSGDGSEMIRVKVGSRGFNFNFDSSLSSFQIVPLTLEIHLTQFWSLEMSDVYTALVEASLEQTLALRTSHCTPNPWVVHTVALHSDHEPSTLELDNPIKSTNTTVLGTPNQPILTKSGATYKLFGWRQSSLHNVSRYLGCACFSKVVVSSTVKSCVLPSDFTMISGWDCLGKWRQR